MLKKTKNKIKKKNLTLIFDINLSDFAIVKRIITILTIKLKKKEEFYKN